MVAERAGFRCEYCRAPERVFNFAFEVEHIYPRKEGGDDAEGNLSLSCESCNLHKGVATKGWDAVEKRNIDLFHPRRDFWNQHFGYDDETGEIVGLTATGRVTVARLKMNSAYQIRARRHWRALGLFP